MKRGFMEIIKNRNYIEKMYMLLGGAIFTHYVLVILLCILLLKDIFVTREYKKILKDKSLVIVEAVLGLSIITSLFYKNYYGLIAIPMLLCIMVGRYYTRIVSDDFKNYNLELMAKFSGAAFFVSLAECLITKERAGYFAYLNPNYLGNIMMMAAIVNLYLALKKRTKLNFLIFILNFITIVMSGSRSALAAAIIGIFVLLYYFLEKKVFFVCVLLLSVYIAGVYCDFLPFLREDSISKYYGLRKDILKMALRAFKSNILFGHGNFYYFKYTKFYPHSHNAVTELLISYGLIGTVALMAVWLKYIYDIFKDDKSNVLKISILLGVVAHNLTDFPIFWIQTVLLFIMILSCRENKDEVKKLRFHSRNIK